jgi:hypothetical protein
MDKRKALLIALFLSWQYSDNIMFAMQNLTVLYHSYVSSTLNAIPAINRARLRWEKRVGHRRLRRAGGVHWQPPRNRPFNQHVDLYKYTGMWERDFLHVYDLVKDSIAEPRLRANGGGVGGRKAATVLTPMMRLATVLHIIRSGISLRELSQQVPVQVSASTLCRDLRHIVPLIYSRLNTISLSPNWSKCAFEDVAGAIDCTAHPHSRIHAGQVFFLFFIYSESEAEVL